MASTLFEGLNPSPPEAITTQLEDALSCGQKERLAKEYEEATSNFFDAVRKLRQKMGICPKDEMNGSNEPPTKRG
jgi:hypothetical protein